MSDALVTFDSTDEFLAHYGVAGMKWGRRKAAYNEGGGTRTERHQRESDRRVASDGALKASLKVAGKATVSNLMINAGAAGLSKAVRDPRAKLGIRVLGGIIQVANTASAIRDIHGLDKAADRREGRA